MPVIYGGPDPFAVPKKRKKRSSKKSSTTRRIARQEARRVLRQETETKTFDGGATVVGVDWSGTNTLFNMTYDPISALNIQQGVADTEYIGSEIRPTYLTIRGVLGLGDIYNVVRIIVVQDRVSGVALSGANILASVGNIRAPLSPYEKDYDDTFRVLADRTYMIDQVERQHVYFKIKIPGSRMRKITFKDSNGLIESGGLYMLVISDSGATAHPTVLPKWRLSFKDI